MAGSAKQWVYDLVKRDVLEGVLRPGERIVDTELATRLGISRMPVREALLALAREGLVRVVPRNGYFVSEISVSDALDAYQLRMILEPVATAMATRQIGDEALRALRALAEEEIEDSPDGSIRAMAVNRAFHVYIAEASGNARLARIIAELMDDLTRLAYVEVRAASSVASWRDEHLQIVAAMEQRDPVRAAEVVRGTFLRDEGLLALRARTALAHLDREGETGAQRLSAQRV